MVRESRGLKQSSQEPSTLMVGQCQAWSGGGGGGRMGAGIVETIDRDADTTKGDDRCGE